MWKIIRHMKTPKETEICLHNALTVYVYYDILNGFTVLHKRCLYCSKTISLDIFKTES